MSNLRANIGWGGLHQKISWQTPVWANVAKGLNPAHKESGSDHVMRGRGISRFVYPPFVGSAARIGFGENPIAY